MRKVLGLVALGVTLTALLPAAQAAPKKVKLVSCVNMVMTNEPGELNRCKDARLLRYDYMEVTDAAAYTSAEGNALEVWPVSTDGKLSVGACFKAFADRDACVKVPEPFRPTAIAASPDGRHLYVVNANNGITIFDSGAAGALTNKDCIAIVGGEASCAKRFPGEQGPSHSIEQVRVSPDGERLYAFDSRGVLTFRRQANGSLEYVGCLKLTKSVCAPTNRYGFGASHAGIAVSPDSKFVYAVGGDTSESYKVKGQPVAVVSVLARTDSAPGLRQVQFLKLPVWGVSDDRGRGSAAVSPDGRHVYATIKDRLVTLTRNKQSGTVRVTRCMSDESFPDYDTMKCASMTGPGLYAAHAVTLTRDGRGVALAGYHGISFLKRTASTGALGTSKKGRVLPQACVRASTWGGPCNSDITLNFGPGAIAFSKRGDRLFTTAWVESVLMSMTTPFGGGARTTSSAAAVDHRLGINNWMVGASRSLLGKRSSKVSVGKVRLWRYTSSRVEAEITVQQGGVPAKASSLTCTTDFPTEKAFGGPKVDKWDKIYLLKLAPPGEVHCLHGFRNAQRYEGKLMTGVTEFTVGKTKVKRKYSVRIGSGTSLSGAKGAVISK